LYPPPDSKLDTTRARKEDFLQKDSERQFHRDMLAGAERLKREIGYNPTRFIKMVAEGGGVNAARQLLGGRDASDGFTTLWEHGRLDMSVEAFALLPWYRSLFTEDQLETAERRLIGHDFDIEQFLRRSALDPPQWAKPGCLDDNPAGQ
jgi:hypothetical protein